MNDSSVYLYDISSRWGTSGLLKFHQFTCCLLADIRYSRYEQNEFERSNWVHFPVWKLSFALGFYNNLILSDCYAALLQVKSRLHLSTNIGQDHHFHTFVSTTLVKF